MVAEVDYEKIRRIIAEENNKMWILAQATFVSWAIFSRFRTGVIVAIVALGGGAGVLKFTGLI